MDFFYGGKRKTINSHFASHRILRSKIEFKFANAKLPKRYAITITRLSIAADTFGKFRDNVGDDEIWFDSVYFAKATKIDRICSEKAFEMYQE